MADEQTTAEAVEKIKTAVRTGNMHFPAKVEEHGIFPLKFKKDREPVVFEYVSLRGGFGPRTNNDHPERSHHGGFALEWGAKGIGFGELTFRLVGGKKNEETGEIEGGKMICDSECMGRDFVRAAFAHFADNVEIE